MTKLTQDLIEIKNRLNQLNPQDINVDAILLFESHKLLDEAIEKSKKNDEALIGLIESEGI